MLELDNPGLVKDDCAWSGAGAEDLNLSPSDSHGCHPVVGVAGGGTVSPSQGVMVVGCRGSMVLVEEGGGELESSGLTAALLGEPSLDLMLTQGEDC